jgi:hypothetical protein
LDSDIGLIVPLSEWVSLEALFEPVLGESAEAGCLGLMVILPSKSYVGRLVRQAKLQYRFIDICFECMNYLSTVLHYTPARIKCQEKKIKHLKTS